MNEAVRNFAKALLRPLKPIVDVEFDRQVRQRARLIPIEQTEPEDVFLVGYPKSGNTWLQHMVAGTLFGMDMRLTPDALVQDVVPEVHWLRFYRRFQNPTFFLSHDLPRPTYRRVVYLVRDGRDAMVSYFHYLSALSDRELDFHTLVTTGEGLFPCRWHEHVEAWMANPHNADILVVTYEALRANPVSELRRICAFAGLQRSDELLQAVAEACSFAGMREKEKTLGWDDRSNWPKDKSFVRRGVVGSFKDEMPGPALEVFMRQSAAALKLAGYVAE